MLVCAYVYACVFVQWSQELADQEKVFMQQAEQVQKWDRSLAESADKVSRMQSHDQSHDHHPNERWVGGY